jgi:hypothetical protein
MTSTETIEQKLKAAQQCIIDLEDEIARARRVARDRIADAASPSSDDIARAAITMFNTTLGWHGFTWEEVGARYRDYMLAQARVAIEAYLKRPIQEGERMAIDYDKLSPEKAALARARFGGQYRKQEGRGMNKTEWDFKATCQAAWLKGQILSHYRPENPFRLAGNTVYSPDRIVKELDERISVIEIKGHMRDDAAVKLKVAAHMYPQYRWLLVKRGPQGSWRVQEVTGEKGIGRKHIHVPWILGS